MRPCKHRLSKVKSEAGINTCVDDPVKQRVVKPTSSAPRENAEQGCFVKHYAEVTQKPMVPDVLAFCKAVSAWNDGAVF